MADEHLAHVMLQGRLAGLSWAKIAETLGIPHQLVYSRWATRLREIDEPAAPVVKNDAQSEIPFDQ